MFSACTYDFINALLLIIVFFFYFSSLSYKLMTECWSLESRLRPTVSEVVSLLTPSQEDQAPAATSDSTLDTQEGLVFSAPMENTTAQLEAISEEQGRLTQNQQAASSVVGQHQWKQQSSNVTDVDTIGHTAIPMDGVPLSHMTKHQQVRLRAFIHSYQHAYTN